MQTCYQIQGDEIKLEPDFLDRNGYRLPTEAEWEYACRAGAGVPWGHGFAERRLGQYAWFVKNSDEHLWPVSRLLPNEAGLFDMAGNGLEWCHDLAQFFPQGLGELPTLLGDVSIVSPSSNRVLRGGSLVSTSFGVRVADRHFDRPDVISGDVLSFRPSKTYP